MSSHRPFCDMLVFIIFWSSTLSMSHNSLRMLFFLLSSFWPSFNSPECMACSWNNICISQIQHHNLTPMHIHAAATEVYCSVKSWPCWAWFKKWENIVWKGVFVVSTLWDSSGDWSSGCSSVKTIMSVECLLKERPSQNIFGSLERVGDTLGIGTPAPSSQKSEPGPCKNTEMFYKWWHKCQ